MLYFSRKPVAPGSIEPEQYAALIAFKASCKNRGLLEEYEDLVDFGAKSLKARITALSRSGRQRSQLYFVTHKGYQVADQLGASLE